MCTSLRVGGLKWFGIRPQAGAAAQMCAWHYRRLFKMFGFRGRSCELVKFTGRALRKTNAFACRHTVNRSVNRVKCTNTHTRRRSKQPLIRIAHPHTHTPKQFPAQNRLASHTHSHTKWHAVIPTRLPAAGADPPFHHQDRCRRADTSGGGGVAGARWALALSVRSRAGNHTSLACVRA